MINVLIADDEPTLLKYLHSRLEVLWNEEHSCIEACNGQEALEKIRQFQPDIAFLDIQMPLMTGLEVAHALKSENNPCRIVFVTAFDQYAVHAFEANAVDYLLKPVSDSRLKETLNRLQTSAPSENNLLHLMEQLQAKLPVPKKYLQWIRIQEREDVRLLAVNEIAYFKSDHKYTLVQTLNEEHLLRTSLKNLEMDLDPERFWRVHRGILVNVYWIETAERLISGALNLHLKHLKKPLKVSRTYAHLFKQM